MEKIYGYKESDVLGLVEFLKEKGNSSLSSAFERYGEISGKAKGTVRNLYYSLARLSNRDKEFCDKYLNGKPLSVGKIVEFNELEEKELIKKILLLKNDGRSVRSAIMELCGGDGKIMLRYQNKYRNAVKNKPELVELIIKELREDGHEISIQTISDNKKVASKTDYSRIIFEMDKLIGKISNKMERENLMLKNRISVLEKENSRLLRLLYGQTLPCSVVKELHNKGMAEYIN